jgi:hypothetical protein
MSSQKTADYDILSVKIIQATHPAYTALMSDGVGGTLWSTLSTVGQPLAPFRYISTDAKTYIADASFNTLVFSNADGVRFSTQNTSTYIYALAFQNLLVGEGSLTTSTFRLSTKENFTFSTGFSNQLFFQLPTTFLGGAPISTNTKLVGTQGVVLSTTQVHYIAVSLSSFTAVGLEAMSNTVSTLEVTLPSSFEGYYTLQTALSTSIRAVSTTTGQGISSLLGQNLSTAFQTIQALSNFSSQILSTAISSFTGSTYTQLENGLGYSVSTLSTFSSCLSLLMEKQTLASTNTIFGQATYPTPTGQVSRFSATLDSGLSNASTALDIYDSKAKNTEFHSSFRSLQTQIRNFQRQEISTIFYHVSTFVSTTTTVYSTLTQSTSRFISMFSTIPFSTYMHPAQSVSPNFDIYLSSCEISLSTLAPYVSTQTRVFLNYAPNVSFSTFQRYISDGHVLSRNTYTICTFLVMGGSHLVPNSLFTDQMQCVSTLPPYTRPLRLEINKDYIADFPFVVTHCIQNAAYINRNLAASNSEGGIVQVDGFYQDCVFNLTNRVSWTNAMNSTTGLSLYIQNAVLT